MTEPHQGFTESVAKFRAELATALTRSRRAAADARAQVAAFRRETRERDVEIPTSESVSTRPDLDDDDEDFSQNSIVFRR
ncbi:MAG: hypothetical protein M3443_13505 [Actinomycetota bacterium]|nr:hypothetical protein [Actinomycetota bacterium]